MSLIVLSTAAIFALALPLLASTESFAQKDAGAAAATLEGVVAAVEAAIMEGAGIMEAAVSMVEAI